MKKTTIISILLVFMLILISCGSREGAAKNGKPAADTAAESIDSINNVMQSVETTVDSLEDAALIDLNNLD